jgi:ubiquinone/menaquinone biosynthesis C-methylase UbiE
MSPRINWIINNVTGKKILDVGFAGSEEEYPTVFKLLREKFPGSEVIGMDINAAKVKSLNFSDTIIGDIRKIPLSDNVFDTVIVGELMEHVYFWNDVLKEPKRVLKKDGRLLLTTPNPFGLFRFLRNFVFPRNPCAKENIKNYLGYHDHKAFYDPLSIVNALYSVGFRKVSYTSTNISLPFLPQKWRDPDLTIWPLNRFGTYSCFCAIK